MATVNKNKKIRVPKNGMSQESRMFAHTAIDLNPYWNPALVRSSCVNVK